MNTVFRPAFNDLGRGDRWLFGLALLVLAMSLAFGGAGDSHVTLSTCIQMISVALLALTACSSSNRASGRFILCGKILATAALVLPAIQLIPLPASTWAALPGHGRALAVLTAIGAPAAPRPLSLDPAATLAAALELLPGVALFWVVGRLDPQRRHMLLALVLAAALVSALLGAFQRAAGLATLFADAHAPYGPGLFVNRNHQATLMLVAIVLTPAVVGRTRHAVVPIAALIFSGGVVATTSRAGLALLPLALVLAALLTVDRRFRPRDLLVGLGALALLAAAAFASGAVRLVAARFSDGSDRYGFWQATWPAVRDFWPWGSGVATFAQVFPDYEPDATIGPFRVPAAHNDYLQLLLEGGAPALVLIVAALVLLALAALHIGRRATDDDRHGQAAAAAIALILLHSILDFPLRMIALSAVFGLLAGVLLTAADRRA